MTDHIRSAEVPVPCAAALAETLAFLTDRLGFRVDAVFPADDPAVAVVSGHGVRLRLERDGVGEPGALRLLCDDPAAVAGGALDLTAPNGMRIEFVPAASPIELPPHPPSYRPSFVLTRAEGTAAWTRGRAGMDYRDLIPDRRGGRFIASHIRIAAGGPVADYVHFHRVRSQMIFCRRGWVRVVYEDQGAPFVMNEGDCVLQPPGIRHRVLDSSPGLEVVEISSPAAHETLADHDLTLPTGVVRPDRVFEGQRFVRHVAADAAWTPGPLDGLEHRDTGIAAATDGLAAAHVVRIARGADVVFPPHDTELCFAFVLSGSATLRYDPIGAAHLSPDDAFAVPPGAPHAFATEGGDVTLLRVTLPASVV